MNLPVDLVILVVSVVWIDASAVALNKDEQMQIHNPYLNGILKLVVRRHLFYLLDYFT